MVLHFKMAGVPLVVAVRGVAGAGSLLESTVCVATTGDLVGSDFSCPSMLLTSLTKSTPFFSLSGAS